MKAARPIFGAVQKPLAIFGMPVEYLAATALGSMLSFGLLYFALSVEGYGPAALPVLIVTMGIGVFASRRAYQRDMRTASLFFGKRKYWAGIKSDVRVWLCGPGQARKGRK